MLDGALLLLDGASLLGVDSVLIGTADSTHSATPFPPTNVYTVNSVYTVSSVHTVNSVNAVSSVYTSGGVGG